MPAPTPQVTDVLTWAGMRLLLLHRGSTYRMRSRPLGRSIRAPRELSKLVSKRCLGMCTHVASRCPVPCACQVAQDMYRDLCGSMPVHGLDGFSVRGRHRGTSSSATGKDVLGSWDQRHNGTMATEQEASLEPSGGTAQNESEAHHREFPHVPEPRIAATPAQGPPL